MALTEFYSNALKEPRARRTLAMVDSNRVVMETVGTLSGGREVPLPRAAGAGADAASRTAAGPTLSSPAGAVRAGSGVEWTS